MSLDKRGPGGDGALTTPDVPPISRQAHAGVGPGPRQGNSQVPGLQESHHHRGAARNFPCAGRSRPPEKNISRT